MCYSGPFCPEKVEPSSTRIDKVLRKFPYQMTNKEFKASDKKVIKSNPIAMLFFFCVCVLVFVEKQSNLVLYSNDSLRAQSTYLIVIGQF